MGILIITAVLMIVALIAFVMAFSKKDGGDPSPVQLIALGLALWILAQLIPVFEQISKQ